MRYPFAEPPITLFKGYVGTSVDYRVVMDGTCCVGEPVILFKMCGLHCKAWELDNEHVLGDQHMCCLLQLTWSGMI